MIRICLSILSRSSRLQRLFNKDLLIYNGASTLRRLFYAGFLFCVLFQVTVHTWPKDRPDSGGLYLITKGACGSHWLMYCIQNLAHIPIYAKSKPWNYLDEAITPNRQNSAIYFDHNGFIDRSVNSKTNRLVVVVRNYRECLLRVVKVRGLHLNYLFCKNDLYEEYLAFIRLFHRWDPKMRLLIRYEDLIANPKATLKEVLDFYGLDDSRLDTFMTNFHAHKQRSLAFYNQHQGAKRSAISNGNHLQYHSQALTPKQCRIIDQRMKYLSNALWKKYLSQYAISEI